MAAGLFEASCPVVKLRRIDGWWKIAAVFSQQTAGAV